MADDDIDPVLTRLTAESGGNFARAKHVAASLRRLQESDDPDLRRLADDILDGKRGLRSVVQDPAFNKTLDTEMPRLFRRLDDLDPEEREAMIAKGRAMYSPGEGGADQG